MPRDHRLRRRAEFLEVQRDGERVHTRHFVVVLRRRDPPDAPSRIGVTVTKRVANAVGRNRVKRLVREVFRRNRPLFPDGCDVVIIAKSGAPLLGYAEVEEELGRIRRRMASILTPPQLSP
ncbi:MAG: ribonuclease P protein component [Sandaracinaceae bacterium]